MSFYFPIVVAHFFWTNLCYLTKYSNQIPMIISNFSTLCWYVLGLSSFCLLEENVHFHIEIYSCFCFNYFPLCQVVLNSKPSPFLRNEWKTWLPSSLTTFHFDYPFVIFHLPFCYATFYFSPHFHYTYFLMYWRPPLMIKTVSWRQSFNKWYWTSTICQTLSTY